MRNQIFHSPGNEEGELAKIPGDGDPPPPHWDLYSDTTYFLSTWLFQKLHSLSYNPQ